MGEFPALVCALDVPVCGAPGRRAIDVTRAGATVESPAAVCRFAPSPNGELHLGHAYSALINERCARQGAAGQLLLRMEDIDLERCSAAFESAIAADLAWLGISFDGVVAKQSERFGVYADVLATLEQRGLLYPCFCTRGEIAAVIAGHPHWPRDPDGSPVYPGTCRRLSAAGRAARIATGLRPAFRLDMAAALSQCAARLTWQEFDEGDVVRPVVAEPEAWGDVVLARKTIPASYHLAVVIDDDAQSITDVVRGADLFLATGLHRLLQELLGLKEPRYHHHRLILDESGRKLSKSAGSPTLRSLRESGVSSDHVRAQLGFPRG